MYCGLADWTAKADTLCCCYVVRFLASFLIDARGGTVYGSRHSGVQVIIPPGKVCMPTRITCKLVRGDKLASPPQLKEGEAIVSRGLELGPVAFQFNGFVSVLVTLFDCIVNHGNNVLQQFYWDLDGTISDNDIQYHDIRSSDM